MIDRLHGPSFLESFREPPVFLVVFWLTGGLFFIIETFLYIQHNRALKAVDPFTNLCRDYQWIIILPEIFCATSFLALFVPRAFYLFEFIRITTEAFALMMFQHSMILLMAAQGGKGCGYGPQGEYTRQSNKALCALPPQRIWSVPPLGCFFRKCEKPRTLTVLKVHIATALVTQYMYVAPIMSVLEIMVLLNIKAPEMETAFISAVAISSMLIAVYGLFVLYAATHNVLGQDFNTTSKFAAVKALVILEKATSWTLKLLGKWFGVYFLSAEQTPAYDDVARQMLLVSYLTVVESVFLTMLMKRAFPPSDLAVAHSLRTSGLGRLDMTWNDPCPHYELKRRTRSEGDIRQPATTPAPFSPAPFVQQKGQDSDLDQPLMDEDLQTPARNSDAGTDQLELRQVGSLIFLDEAARPDSVFSRHHTGDVHALRPYFMTAEKMTESYLPTTSKGMYTRLSQQEACSGKDDRRGTTAPPWHLTAGYILPSGGQADDTLALKLSLAPRTSTWVLNKKFSQFQ
eukprot:g51074.t1